MADVCNQSDCIIKNPRLEMKGTQEKESLMDVWGRYKKIHPSASLVMAVSDRRDGFFYLSFTPIYILILHSLMGSHNHLFYMLLISLA